MPSVLSAPAKSIQSKTGGNRCVLAGYEVVEAFGHSSRVFDVSFCPITPNTFASAADDETVRVWTASSQSQNCEQVGWFNGHTDPVLRVSWSPDATLVASGDSGGMVRMWQAPSKEHYTGREVAVLGPHEEEVYSCQFLSTSRAAAEQLLVGSSTDLYLWDLESMALLQQATPPPPSTPPSQEGMQPYVFDVALQPGGRQLAVCCSDGVVRMWEVGQQGLRLLEELPLMSGMLSCCAFTPDGLYLAAVGKMGMVVLLDVRQKDVLLQFDTGRPALSCAFVEVEGALKLALVGGDSCVRFLSFFSGPGVRKSEVKVPGRFNAPLLTLNVSEDGSCFAAAGNAMLVQELDGTKEKKRFSAAADTSNLSNGLAAMALDDDGGDDDDMFTPLDAILHPSRDTSDKTAKAGDDCEHSDPRRAPVFLWKKTAGV